MDSVGNIIVYFVVAIVMVVFSFKAVTAGKILRAATYLLFVLLGTAVFYFQARLPISGSRADSRVCRWYNGALCLRNFADPPT